MNRIITCIKHITLHEEHYLVENKTSVNSAIITWGETGERWWYSWTLFSGENDKIKSQKYSDSKKPNSN